MRNVQDEGSIACRIVRTTLLATVLAGSSAGFAGQLKAGAAVADMTTPASEFPYAVPREKSFVGVHDPVHARALALDDGIRRVILVAIETTQINDPEAVVKAVADAARVPETAVMVVATHTHSVPLAFFHGGEVTNPTQPRELQRVRDGAASAAKAAVAALRPARIGWARGNAYVNTNNGEETGRKGWFDPTASSDKSLDILRVTGADGKPIALLLNYASHAEVMFRSVTKDGGYEVTGDLPGAVSMLLEGSADGAPVVLFTPAAEGDQLPLFKSLQPAAELPAADAGAGGWALLDAQARRLAAAALQTIATMQPGRADATITTGARVVSCPGQKFDVERPSGRVLGVHDTGPVSIPVMTVRVGDVVLAGVGADIASDIGARIKAASPASQTTVISMIAGAAGYVLNDAAYAHPGHGALGSPVKPGCAPVALSKGISDMLREAR